MPPFVEVLAVAAVALGATMQRTTGLGFALVSAPFLVVLLGPFTGVVLANLLSASVSLVVLAVTARGLRRRVAAQMIAGVLVGVPLGALVVHLLPAPVLLVVVGTVTAASVSWVAAGRAVPMLRHRTGAPVSGFVSGLFNSTAGTGGPPLAVYAASTDWEHDSFVPTVQLVMFTTNVLSVVAKGWPALSAPFLTACAVATAAGIAGGGVLARRLPHQRARRWVLGLALAGSLVAIAKGLLSLL